MAAGQVMSGTILIILLLFITSGCALYCYKCEDTPGSPECSEAQECFAASPKYLEQFKGSLKIDASKPPTPVCFTSVVTYNGEQMSTRGCSVFGSKFTCELYRQTFVQVGQTVSSCDICEENFCNSDTKLSKSAATNGGAPAVVPQSGPLAPTRGPNRRPDTVLSTKLPSVDHVTSNPITSESKDSAASSVYGMISILFITILSLLFLLL